MILYHGSNLTVSEPKLVTQNRFWIWILYYDEQDTGNWFRR